MSVDIPNESRASIVASKAPDIATRCVCADPDNPEISALYAEAFELLKDVCAAVVNLLPIDVCIEADIFASSPKAAANSFKVSRAPGDESTNAATFAFVYVWIELLNVEYPVVCVMFTCADPDTKGASLEAVIIALLSMALSILILLSF